MKALMKGFRIRRSGCLIPIFFRLEYLLNEQLERFCSVVRKTKILTEQASAEIPLAGIVGCNAVLFLNLLLHF